MSLQMSLYYVLANSFNLPKEYDCPDFMKTAIMTQRPILGAYFFTSGVIFIVGVLCFLNLRIIVLISNKITF